MIMVSKRRTDNRSFPSVHQSLKEVRNNFSYSVELLLKIRRVINNSKSLSRNTEVKDTTRLSMKTFSPV
uniref:Uncharacterized protein n=1 Tax=Lepeophtheirus salmonis TaxID=72036 RepID=A0A0K2TZC2_LEPSM